MNNINNEYEYLLTDVKKLINDIHYTPKTFEEIKSILEVTNDELLKKALDELVDCYLLFPNKKNEYLNNRNANKFIGKISIKNDNYGFVTNDYTDEYYVDSFYFEDAMDKDTVLYSICSQKYHNYVEYSAKVIKVLKRYYETLVGEIEYVNGRTYLNCFEKGLKKKCIVSKMGKAKVGDIVLTKVISYEYFLKVEVLDVLGTKKDLGIDITSIVARMDIPYVFSKEVLNEANLLENDAKSGKYQIFNEDKIFTIDGSDAKDLDDAVSIRRLLNNHYLLGVYIADVSHYVTKGSLLDKEALKRGTSVYLVDRVIPMLPEVLSNDLCSLNPNEEKLVLALFMELNEDGVLVDSVLKEGVIKTTKRLSYEVCNDVFENGLENYDDMDIVYDSLLLMRELASKLEKKREERGAINFDSVEAKIICDEKGKAVDITLRTQGVSEKIIEEFMILANETVATIINSLDLPFIYRVHEKMDYGKFFTLKGLVENLGYQIKSPHPKQLQTLINNLDEEYSYLKTTIIRMMNKAIYSEENIGHFGLASKCYTHFTSPIRRYPDLLVHRLLRRYIIEKQIGSLAELDELEINIASIAKEASTTERRAQECEFKVLDMKKCEYLEKYVGSEFIGNISSVLSFGVFVTLPNTIEGLIHNRKLRELGFVLSDDKTKYINKHNKDVLSLGTEVKIRVLKADKKNSEIDFELMYNNVTSKKDYFKKNSNRKGNHEKRRKNKNHR